MESTKNKTLSQHARYTEKDEILFSAASGGDQTLLKTSLAQGADLMAANKKGRTAIHLASKNGHYSTVKTLLQNRASVEAKDDDGRTALALAVENGHCEVAWCLWKNGAKISRRDHRRQTPLHIAALRNQIGAAQLLIGWGANVRAKDEDGRTPLVLASRLGYEVLAEIILLHKGDANSTDNHGWTSLHFAVCGGHISLASLLFENGANLTTATNNGETIVSLAASSGNEDMKQLCSKIKIPPPSKAPEASEEAEDENELIFESLASLQLTESLTEELVDPSEALASALAARDSQKIPYLVRMGANINKGRNDGMTALMTCASWGDVGLVGFLLRQSASIDATDYLGRTALWWAVSHCIKQTTKILLDHRATVDLADSNQLTPLMIAALRGRTDIAQLLVQHGANVNCSDLEGRTPLWWAIEYGQASAVAFLLENGAAPDLPAQDGAIPLCCAALPGHGTIVKLLLEHGANINSLDTTGRTALSNAAVGSHEMVVETLLNHGGAILNIQDAENRTAIMHAAENGNSILVELLIEAGAQLDLEDTNGANALSLAVANDNQEAARLLSEATSRPRQQSTSHSNAEMEVSDGPQSKPYQYQPLSGESKIRIMALQPGRQNEALSFELNEVDLADRPVYQALSYEWGAKVGTIPVKANGGRILRITPNLKDSLRRLRLPKEPRMLWIDAVCINQNNMEEKNRQVPMMAEIYRNANIVIFWIGDQDAYTQAAFSAIPSLFMAWQILKAQPSSSRSALEFDVNFVEDIDQIPELKPLLSNLVPYSPAFRGLENIFLNTFFTRAWILQEIMLATQAVVLSGRFHCEWETFRKALIALLHCKDAIGMPLVNSSAVNILKFHQSFKAGHWDLQKALSNVMLEFKASNPRDKIYAMLGLAETTSPSGKLHITPDYNLSVQDVYIDAARNFIDESGRLSCWEGCNIPRTKQIQGLPSWVPDWTVTQRITFAENAQNPLSANGTFSTPHSKALLIAGQPATTKKCLFVNGCVLDRIVSQIPLTIEREASDIIFEAVGVLASLGHDIFKNYPISIPLATKTIYLDILWRTLQWDKDQGGVPNEEILCFLVWKIMAEDITPPKDEELPKKVRQMLERCEQLMGLSRQYEPKIIEELEQRLRRKADLIITERGLLGIASSGAAEEDMVIVLLGGATELSLLRERRDSEQGDAWYEYVDNIFMDHWRGPIESLEEVEDDAVIRRLEIR